MLYIYMILNNNYVQANEEYQFHASNNEFYLKALKFESYQQGFYYFTEDYIYSKYSRITNTNQYLNEDSKFYDLDDEVIKQLNENCQSGDLRVRIFTRSLPPFITIVGEQQNSKIVPHKISKSESFFIVKEGEIEIPELIHEITETCDNNVFDMRLISFVVVFVGYIINGSSSIYLFKVFYIMSLLIYSIFHQFQDHCLLHHYLLVVLS